MSGKQIHVTHREDGWQVKSAGSDRPYRVTGTKAEANSIGRDVAKNQGAELIVHGVDGKIQSRNSYGNDPFPPKG